MIFLFLLNIHQIVKGDLLKISVWGVEELTGVEVRVDEDGYIAFPWTKRIKAEGLTLTQLEDTLEKHLSRYIKNCKVSILLVESSINKVYVYGEVKNPGIYRIEPGMTLLDALTLAGGVTPSADLSNIKIIRKGKEILCDIRNPNISEFVLRPSDIIKVGKLNPILIFGDVEKSGEYYYDKIKIFELLAIAKVKTGKIKKIEILTENNRKIKFDRRKLEKGALRYTLKPGDIVYVEVCKKRKLTDVARDFAIILSPVLTVIIILNGLKNLGWL